MRNYLANHTISPKLPQDLTDRIIDEINLGVIIDKYAGPAPTRNWAHEGIFSTHDFRTYPMIKDSR